MKQKLKKLFLPRKTPNDKSFYQNFNHIEKKNEISHWTKDFFQSVLVNEKDLSQHI